MRDMSAWEAAGYGGLPGAAPCAAPQASAEAGTCESTWGGLWDGTQTAGYCGLGTSQVTVRDGQAPISGS